jgi:arylsulfatase A-like enzyme
MKAIVIEVPALHLGYLGCYGNDWIDTPNFDRLAAEGVVFDQHIADCPGGVRSSWCGRYDFPQRDGQANQSEGVTAFDAKILKAKGIPLHAVIAPDSALLSADNYMLDEVMGQVAPVIDVRASESPWILWIRFPRLAPPWKMPEWHLEKYFTVEAEDIEQANEQEADSNPLTPWFDPPSELISLNDSLWKRLQTSYASVINYLDEQIGLILEDLDQPGLGNQVLLSVTAPYGLALGEHGIIGDCRPWLHEELIHVPLIMRLPGGAEAGRRVSALTQPVDLLPTLLAAFDVSLPEDVHGHSLWPLIRGETEKVREYACAGLRQGERIEWALRTSDWSFILPVSQAVDDPPRSKQLYVKPDDRWEMSNLLQHHLEWGELLEKTLRRFVEASRQPGPFMPPVLSKA